MNLFRQLKALLSEKKPVLTEAKLIDEAISQPLRAKPMDEKTEIKTFEVDRICPSCGKGKMRPFGGMEYGNQHPHRCTACNHNELIAGKIYPYIMTERGTTQQID